MSIEKQSINDLEFEFSGQSNHYKGKVRDVYSVSDQLIMVASDRISAFDHILPRPIPYKGQVLNQIAAYFLTSTSDIVPNWLEATPDPNVAIGKRCEPIRLEMVIRGYLAGHAWREYKAGKRTICGVDMPEGMQQNDRFPEPIITPATKAEEGHDEDISEADILKNNIVTPEQWETLCQYTKALFARGSEMALDMGLILVDTKYEFGLYEGEIILMDEIHTPDSSRYFIAEGYETLQKKGEPQQQLSKEFVREWLMDHGFQGKDGQVMPEMPDEFVWTVSDRYIDLYERITGKEFDKANVDDIEARIYHNVEEYLKKSK